MGHAAATEMWKGPFGDEYHKRQPNMVAANTAFFAQALRRTQEIKRVIELGAGTGMNLQAIRQLLPEADLMAVEVNEKASMQITAGYIFCQNVLTFTPPREEIPDLVVTKGLLIHIPPEDLPRAYTTIYGCTSRYILLAEYYAPHPTMIPYRGQNDRLWKRDFAGEMMSRWKGLDLIDYGFAYHGDPKWHQDDLNWFLLEKR